MKKIYASVVFPIPVHKSFTYFIPLPLREKIALGVRVRAPFRGKRQVGFVVDFPSAPPEGVKLQSVEEVLDSTPLLPFSVLKLTKWMAEYYGSSWGEALSMAIPKGVKLKQRGRQEKFVKLKKNWSEIEEQIPFLEKKTKKGIRVLLLLKEEGGEASLSSLKRALKISSSPFYTLAKLGVVEIFSKEVISPPYEELGITEERRSVLLTEEQQRALSEILKAMEEKKFCVFLLHGVTGSGKTEIYLRAIEKALSQGRSALMLLPEISLTPQTLKRFRAFFGSQVALLHSAMSDSQRFHEWQRIQRGEASVVIGPRSAVFAPLKNLALVVVDEEHEASFKEQASPRYHGRDVAIFRAKLEKAVVVLGSATPSLVSYENARRGKYILLRLPRRVTPHPLPQVEIVDMRQEWDRAGRPVLFSERLKELLSQTLSKEEQAILLLNRRGFATQMVCRRCGYVFRCQYCDITLTYHKKWERVLCHYCGYGEPTPKECPSCFFPVIRFLGMGTERVEETLKRLFPSFSFARLDGDIGQKKLIQILEDFQKRKIQVLLGTQRIAKGLDFPGVTLVGVISADVGLHLPDFLATERTFQLLTQVAGRAGRGDKPGKVVIQTFVPEHYSILAAAEQNYEKFFQKELALRKRFGYPPFQRLVRLVSQHKSLSQAKKDLEKLKARLPFSLAARLLGPVACPIGQIQGEYRFHILGKFDRVSEVQALVRESQREIPRLQSKVYLDVDPVGVL